MYLFKQAAPAIVSSLMMYFQEVMNTVFAGHFGDPKLLAAIGLGNMTVNMLAVDIFCPLN